MAGFLKIRSVEVCEFRQEVREVATAPIYAPGAVRDATMTAIRIETDAGIAGEHVTYAGLEAAGARQVAQSLIGRNALEREKIYQDLKRVLRQVARIGIAAIDIALWDLAGKYYNAPVYELLGGYRTKLPCYASTFHADDAPNGLSSPEAFADFAEQCLQMGYKAFKLHTWWEGPIEREIATIRAVGKRVGGKMALMLDPASGYETLTDAVLVGRACDEQGFYWYEDPYKDTGVAHLAHRKLRELIKTPILQAEHVRGLEDRANFITADATDLVRGDVEYDGITATMKLANAAEALGIDIEIHIGTVPSRHCMAAIRNSNFLEWGLVHPRVENGFPCFPPGYDAIRLDAIDAEGRIAVPSGPGLGVQADWGYIRDRVVSRTIFE
ncbi:MAG: enolase C-terminal domain-like protein [Chloroflexota bacterium]